MYVCMYVNYTTLGLIRNASSCIGNAFIMWERLAARHLCSSSLMLKGRSQGWCGLVVSLGLDLCWTNVTVCFYMFCAWTRLHSTLRGTPLELVLRGCLKQITRPHQHCGHRSGLALAIPLRIVRQHRGVAGWQYRCSYYLDKICAIITSRHIDARIIILLNDVWLSDPSASMMISTTDEEPDILHIPNIFFNPEDAFSGDVELNKINMASSGNKVTLHKLVKEHMSASEVIRHAGAI